MTSAPARAELQAAAGTYEALHLLNPSASCWRSALALALAAGDPAEARRLTDRELQDARRAGRLRPAGITLRTRGVLEGGERGLRDLREAAELLEASGARLEHARALVELGAALRRANQRTAARQPLRAGLDLAYRCGATRLAERARAELLTAGARPRRRALTGLETGPHLCQVRQQPGRGVTHTPSGMVEFLPNELRYTYGLGSAGDLEGDDLGPAGSLMCVDVLHARTVLLQALNDQVGRTARRFRHDHETRPPARQPGRGVRSAQRVQVRGGAERAIFISI